MNLAAQRAHKPARALAEVLTRNEHVQDLVGDAAQDLSSANAVLENELREPDAPPAMADALEISQVAENKVQDAADQLAAVNVALKNEVRERHVLEIQLEAVKERGQTSHHSGFHDLVTGLPNQELFSDRLEHGLAQAKRQGWNLAVMFIALDDFKHISASNGSGAGDAVLQMVATRLAQNSRADDTLGRHDADEFRYLLVDIRDEFDLTAIAQNLIASMREPFDIQAPGGPATIHISISIGIAVFPQDGATPQALVKCADTALVKAKASAVRYSFAH